MKNPKVGERCRRYSCSFPGEFFDGIITRVINGDVVEVKPDKGGTEDFHHRTHLIRLKLKKKPEVIEFETTWKPEFKSSHITTSPTQHQVSVPYLEAIKFYGKRCKVTVEILGEWCDSKT